MGFVYIFLYFDKLAMFSTYFHLLTVRTIKVALKTILNAVYKLRQETKVEIFNYSYTYNNAI